MNEKKKQVKRIFDSIAFRYDFLNHLLSAGVDYYWRRKAIKLTGFSKESVLLDIACGTGDFSACARRHGVKKIIGADFSHNMLALFRKKSPWIAGNEIQLVAEDLPVINSSVTNITVAFGVRNFYDIPKAFESFRQALKTGGKVTVLEFRLPSNLIIRSLYVFYFKNILPFIGGIISKDKEAYAYLPSSVEEFDKKVNLELLFKNAGFVEVETHVLTFGIAQVVIARK
jgi:demethylmenaquinone methyltransferase/2-methoxy-6-polyprenyl-1,4-benzoquinol methylase